MCGMMGGWEDVTVKVGQAVTRLLLPDMITFSSPLPLGRLWAVPVDVVDYSSLNSACFLIPSLGESFLFCEKGCLLLFAPPRPWTESGEVHDDQ